MYVRMYVFNVVHVMTICRVEGIAYADRAYGHHIAQTYVRVGLTQAHSGSPFTYTEFQIKTVL